METSAVELSDWLLAHGRTSVTTTEAAEALGIPAEQVRVRLHRQVKTQRLFSPARGLWVPVPPEYRSWGVTPVTHFLHDLMTHLHRTYYLGWLSAAELHGASHQRVQVSQVAVDRPTDDREIGRARLRFHTRTHLALLRSTTDALPHGRAVRANPVPTGSVLVSCPELTALDLCEHPVRGGGVSNVATVVAELTEGVGLDPGVLDALAPTASAAASRRLGHLLTLLSTQDLLDDVDVAPLLEDLQRHLRVQGSTRPVLLDPRGPQRGRRDQTWGLVLNTDVEPDL